MLLQIGKDINSVMFGLMQAFLFALLGATVFYLSIIENRGSC